MRSPLLLALLSTTSFAAEQLRPHLLTACPAQTAVTSDSSTACAFKATVDAGKSTSAGFQVVWTSVTGAAVNATLNVEASNNGTSWTARGTPITVNANGSGTGIISFGNTLTEHYYRVNWAPVGTVSSGAVDVYGDFKG